MNILLQQIKRLNIRYIIVVALFITYLIFADYIFLDVLHVKGEYPMAKTISINTSGGRNCWVENIQVKETSWKNTVSIRGGVIPENTMINIGDMVIKVYLKNMMEPDEIFMVSTDQQTVDIKDNSELKSKSFQHYRTLFSVHKLKDVGLYRIGILVESNKDKSFTWTDNYLDKNGDEITIKSLDLFISSKTKIDYNNLEPDKTQGGIDNIEMSAAKESDVLKIYGWAVVPDKNSELQKGYVVIKDAKGNKVVYDTFRYSTPVVADILKSDLYSESGIYAAIPVSDLTDGEYEISIYSENNGLYEMGVKKAIVITDGGKKVNIRDLNSFISSQTKLDFNSLRSDKVDGGIDKIEMSTANKTNVMKIYGWAVVPEKKSELQKGYVVIKDAKGNKAIYGTIAYSSPMVAELFKSDLYSTSGIYAAIPVSDLTDGEYDVYIYTENDGLYEMQVNKKVEVADKGKNISIKGK